VPGIHESRMSRSALAFCMAGLLGAATLGTVLGAEPGDEPSTAIPVAAGTSQYDSTAMTSSAADPAACPDPEFAGPFSNTMWFSYTPDRDASTLVDVNSFVSDGSTDFLAIVFVYAVTDGGLELVACSAFPATVFFAAESGVEYLIVVGGLSASALPDEDPALLDRGGTFDLSITAIRGRVLRDHFHETDTFVDEGLTEECGGDVTVTFDDHGTAKTFFDANGPRAFTFQISGWTTFQMGDGPVVKVSYHQTFRDYFDGTFSQVGIPVKVTVDGTLLYLDAGRVVFGPDGGVIFEAGPHPVLHEGFDLCALLAG
jgi:hypothetical protein